MIKSFKEEDFKGWFLEFFQLYPFVTRIQWVQYAPYFNDGVPCVFSVHEPEMELSVSFVAKNPDLLVGLPDYPSDEDREEGNSTGRFLGNYTFDKGATKQYPDLAQAVKTLKELFEADDILELVFGEHSQIVVTPEKIVVEEYEHD
jgi:hypothetical protein